MDSVLGKIVRNDSTELSNCPTARWRSHDTQYNRSAPRNHQDCLAADRVGKRNAFDPISFPRSDQFAAAGSTPPADDGRTLPYDLLQSLTAPLAPRGPTFNSRLPDCEHNGWPPATRRPGLVGPGAFSGHWSSAVVACPLQAASASSASAVARRPRALFESTSVIRCTAPRSSSLSTAAISRAMRSSASS